MSIDRNQNHFTQTLATAPLLALLLFAGGCSEKESAAPESTPSAAAPAAEMTEAAPEPMAEATTAVDEMTQQADTAAASAQDAVDTATGAAAAMVDSEGVYKKACMACHAAGVAGAPKLGDSEAWAPRVAKGNDALVESVKNGLNAMPPMGGCMSCSDEELRGAVEYMISQGS